MRYIPFFLLLICLGSCMYIQIAYKGHVRQNETITTTTTYGMNATTSTTRPYVTYNMTVGFIRAECPTNITRVNKTVYITEMKYLYDNITRIQKKKLINLKADSCPSASCGFGYYLCKEEVMDLFDLKHPLFNEAPSTNIRDIAVKKKDTTCLPIQKDWIGEYIKLNSTTWSIYSKPLQPYYMVNRKVFDNMTRILEAHNVSKTVWSQAMNFTYNDTKNIMLRMT